MLTPEYIAEVKELDKKIASGEVEVDTSDIPELDEVDFRYQVSFHELIGMTGEQRSEVWQKIQAAKEAERAALLARKEAETTLAKVRKLAPQT